MTNNIRCKEFDYIHEMLVEKRDSFQGMYNYAVAFRGDQFMFNEDACKEEVDKLNCAIEWLEKF